MSDKRRGLGRGLGALIPSSAAASGNGSAPSRPVDLFFPEARKRTPAADVPETEETVAAPEEDVAAESQAPSPTTAAAGSFRRPGIEGRHRGQEGSGAEGSRRQGFGPGCSA